MLMIIASISGAIACFIFTQRAIKFSRRQRAALTINKEADNSFIDRWIIFSTKLFARFAQKLLKKKVFQELGSRIIILARLQGVNIDEVGALSSMIGITLVSSAIAFVVTLSPVFAISLFILVWALVFTLSNSRTENLTRSMREQVPEALRCMAACSKSGLSLMQSLESTAKECKGTLSDLFASSASRLKLGETTSQSLSILKNNTLIPELKFVAVALDVQHISGGAIEPILESARQSVNNEIELQRNLKVQTSQARLSATIVTLMPFVLLALFSFISPDFLKPFFSSVPGMALFLAAIFMQMTGVVIVRRILNISKA